MVSVFVANLLLSLTVKELWHFGQESWLKIGWSYELISSVMWRLALTVSDVCLKLSCFQSTSTHSALEVSHYKRYINIHDLLTSGVLHIGVTHAVSWSAVSWRSAAAWVAEHCQSSVQRAALWPWQRLPRPSSARRTASLPHVFASGISRDVSTYRGSHQRELVFVYVHLVSLIQST